MTKHLHYIWDPGGIQGMPILEEEKCLLLSSPCFLVGLVVIRLLHWCFHPEDSNGIARSLQWQRQPRELDLSGRALLHLHWLLQKDWLPLPYFYFDGEALAWFTWLHRNKQFFDWTHFKEKLRIRFRQRTFTDSVRRADTSRARVEYVSYATLVPQPTSASPVATLSHAPNSSDLEVAFNGGNSQEANVFDKLSNRADECDSQKSPKKDTSELLDHVSHKESWLIPFLGSHKYVHQHDKKLTIVNEVSVIEKSVFDDILIVESENPNWDEEFALVIKQPLLRDSQLVVLSCIVLHFEQLVWQIVEVVGISNISYSCDAIGLLVRRGNLEHHSGPSSYEDIFSMHLVLELWAGGKLFDGTIARGYSLDKEATHIVGQLLRVVRNCHFTGDDHWNQSLARHCGKVYPHRGLELAQYLEELPCTLSACICDLFIKRSTFDSGSALGHAAT
ncbi:PREDICTED: uncharacterized protein LOC109229904 [Nicotiana attenuata]|uniref:uncharacterized protein LOC109229904 n=1 Tax=Nicotiana attenuata TaxID=49451 RepID=UPI000905D419|nr:PREDICTED: uncharacterized protein LOC109229904 [Nicotiana attenuata]